jgi:hypothetical protein
MCSDRTALFALISGAVFGATAAIAQPPVHTEPMKPFAFTPGAREKVWCAVVLASNAKKGEAPVPIPRELASHEATLVKHYGYHQFEILGTAVKELAGRTEEWQVVTPRFTVEAKTTHVPHGGYHMDLEFFHDKPKPLKIGMPFDPKNPPIISGPFHVRGRIIMVFEVRP